MRWIIITLIALTFIHCSHQEKQPELGEAYDWSYSELLTRDLDEMMETVNLYITKSRQGSELPPLVGEDPEEAQRQHALKELQTAVEFVFSRPDRDNMTSKILPALRQELKSYEAYYDVLERVTEKAQRIISNKGHDLKDRSTAVFIFENLISQLKPFTQRDSQAKALMEKIYQMKVTIPEDIKAHRYLSSLFETNSPSEVAGKILGKKD